MKSKIYEGESLPLGSNSSQSSSFTPTPSPRGKPLRPQKTITPISHSERNEEYPNNTLAFYSKNAQEFISSTQNVDMTEIQNAFTSLLPLKAHVLDLGCGSGRDTLYFLERGFSVTAMDACDEFCKATKNLTYKYQKTGKCIVLQKKFLELSDIQKYEGVWACASLLHVPKKELPAILKKIENALKEKGVFYCSFKKGTFEGERNGRYFSDFTEDELCKAIEKSTQLSKIRLWLTSDARPERSEIWINSLWRK